MKNTYFLASSALFILLILLHSMPTAAQSNSVREDNSVAITEDDSWQLCSPWVLPEATIPDHVKLDQLSLEDGATYMTASNIIAQDETLTALSGDVYIRREHDFIHADHANYIPSLEFFDISGNLHYQTVDSLIYAESAKLSANNDTGQFSKAEFYFENNHISGYAEWLAKDEDNITTLRNTRYTTCDPEQVDWEFQANEIELDENKGFGKAKHLRLYFKQTPIFYLPYITFPINDTRKSGFLLPKVGQSNNRGTELVIPYYWNIAAQADSTIAVHNMTRRGTQLATEWRYMNRYSNNRLHLEHLDDQEYGDTRTLAQLNQSGRLPLGWKTSINFTDISDPDYYADGLRNDLSGSYSSNEQTQLNLARLTSVRNTASLSKPGENWIFRTTFKNFVTVNRLQPETAGSFAELPKIELLGRYYDLPGSLGFEFDSSLTSFTHDTKNDARRLDIYPRVSRVFGTPGWFVIPQAGYRYTQYLIDDPNNSDANSKQGITRSLPILSLDNGLIFERNIGKSERYYQTLEPRVFFAYVPYRPQSAIPLYDTRALGFNFPQLFHANRYTGADRIQDTNHASVALSTEISDSNTGEPIFRTSIGRILYLKDRTITLDNDLIQTDPFSNIISESMFAINRHWSTNLEIEWNSETEKIIKTTAALHYQRDNNHIINFGYRFNRDKLEQSEVVWRWPLSRRWTSVAKWQYSLHDTEDNEPDPSLLNNKHDIETFLGLEYESCCYIFRAVARRFLKPQIATNVDESEYYENEILLQLSFKGFTQFGNDANNLLLQKIRGYEEID